MDEILFNAFEKYYNALGKLGYMSYAQSQKLLILSFFRDFVFHDYHGLLSKEDYHIIERALDCLYGSTCLIPYPDYLKMSKLYLGSMTEMAQRVKTIEDTDVIKAFQGESSDEINPDSDVIIVVEE